MIVLFTVAIILIAYQIDESRYSDKHRDNKIKHSTSKTTTP